MLSDDYEVARLQWCKKRYRSLPKEGQQRVLGRLLKWLANVKPECRKELEADLSALHSMTNKLLDELMKGKVQPPMQGIGILFDMATSNALGEVLEGSLIVAVAIEDAQGGQQ